MKISDNFIKIGKYEKGNLKNMEIYTEKNFEKSIKMINLS